MSSNPTARALLLVVLAASGAACSSPADPFGFKSGSRLKAKYIEGGGTKVFTSFHDSARNEDCAFGLAGYGAMTGPGGVTYCLPTARTEARGFADPKCTERLVEVPEGSGASVVVDAPDRNCEQHPELYGLGEPYQGKTYEQNFDGNCVEGVVLDHPVRRVGAAIPIDTFVRAQETVESAGDRLSRLVLVADDGARLTTAAFDTQRQEAVAPGWFEAGDTQRWEPRGIAFNYGGGSLGTPGTVYVDGACTRPTAVKDAYDAFCPITAVYEFVELDCNSYGVRWHEAGPLLDETKAFAITDAGACVAVDPTPPWEIYMVEMKAEIPLSAFATVARTEVGEGVLVQTFLGEPDQPPLMPSGDLSDRVSHEACAFFPATDGTMRCMPTTSAPDVAFSDPACTKPLASGATSTDCMGTTTELPLPARVLTLDAKGVGTVYGVGASATLPLVYRGDPSSCVSEPGNMSDWHTLDVVDPATLPLGEEKVDP